ncbi:MAG: GAF domain-containing protein [Nitrospirales bacterium]|nr:GAF domain-containing protein [Nitrospirales bacterium]
MLLLESQFKAAFEADEQFIKYDRSIQIAILRLLLQSHPVLGPLARSPEPIFATTVTSHSEEFLDFIRATQALVCVPISCAEGHLLGFSTLSQDQHGRGYDHDDFDLLRVVSHHVAMLLLQFHLQEAQTASAKWEVVHKFSGFYT